jgi:hypothetical protein
MSLFPIPISIDPTDLASSIAGAVVNTLINIEAGLVKDLVTAVMAAAVATTSLGSDSQGWFSGVAGRLFPVEEFVVAPLLFTATIGAIFRQDLHRLARAWAVGLPLALIGGFAVVKLTYYGLGVTDAVTSMVQSQVAPHLGSDFVDAVALVVPGSGEPGPLGALLGLVVIAGGLAIWLELVVRSAAIELAVFFMPLALAGLVWPATAHWAKRLVEVLVALLVAKPIIVGALCLGDNAITSASAGPSSVVTGAAILLMAAFTPFVLLKLVPMAEIQAIVHLQGVSRQPFHAAERVAQLAMAHAGRAAAGAPASADAGSATYVNLLGRMGGASGGGAGDPLGPARNPDVVPAASTPVSTNA